MARRQNGGDDGQERELGHSGDIELLDGEAR